MSIPYTHVILIHYQTLSKEDTTWKIDMKNLFAPSLQGLLLLFPDNHDDFENKSKEFYSLTIDRVF